MFTASVKAMNLRMKSRRCQNSLFHDVRNCSGVFSIGNKICKEIMDLGLLQSQ